MYEIMTLYLNKTVYGRTLPVVHGEGQRLRVDDDQGLDEVGQTLITEAAAGGLKQTGQHIGQYREVVLYSRGQHCGGLIAARPSSSQLTSVTRGWFEAKDPDQVLEGGQDNVPGWSQEVPVTVTDGEDGPLIIVGLFSQ